MDNFNDIKSEEIKNDVKKQELSQLIIRAMGNVYDKDEFALKSLNDIRLHTTPLRVFNNDENISAEYNLVDTDSSGKISVMMTQDNKIVKTFHRRGIKGTLDFVEVIDEGRSEDKTLTALLKPSIDANKYSSMLKNYEQDFDSFGVTKAQTDNSKKYHIIRLEIDKEECNHYFEGRISEEVFIKDIGTLSKNFKYSKQGDLYLNEITFNSFGKAVIKKTFYDNGILSEYKSKIKTNNSYPYIYKNIIEQFDKLGVPVYKEKNLEKDNKKIDAKIIKFRNGEVVEVTKEKKDITTTKKYVNGKVNETIIMTRSYSSGPFDSTVYETTHQYNKKHELTKIVKTSYDDDGAYTVEEIYEKGKHVKNIIDNKVFCLDDNEKLLNKELESKNYNDEYIAKYEKKFVSGRLQIFVTLADGTILSKDVKK